MSLWVTPEQRFAWLSVAALLRLLYSALLALLLPVVFARLAWRSRFDSAYRQRWGERLGYIPVLPKPLLWLHAVSVGEVRTAFPVIDALRQRYPDHVLLVSTVTPTGSRQLRDRYGDSLYHVYLPYDVSGAVGRFLDRSRPCLGIIMETEIWPNLYRACHQRGIPLILANARLSERSARGYQWLGGLVAETLVGVDILARDDNDATRFRQLGAARVRVGGNLKFELQIPTAAQQLSQQLRAAIGNRPVWIAASSHTAEEGDIVALQQRLRQRYPDVLLIWVPRHPERFAAVATRCRDLGLARRSRGESPGPETTVYLGDTVGELLGLYGAADVALVAGSLAPLGGHNPLEPAALGVPVVVGANTANFAEVTAALAAVGALRQAADLDGVATLLMDWLDDPLGRANAGAAGQAVVAAGRGSLERLLARVGVAMVGAVRE